jgi:gluconate kinase
MSFVLHINGWPGCGKLTIARIVATRLNARLLDNHTLLNPAEALFARDDPLHRALRKSLRETTFRFVAQLPLGIPVVFTDALADDAGDAAMFDEYREVARNRSARLVSAVLDCDLEENVRRLTAAHRAEHMKLTRPAVLTALRSKYRLLKPDDVALIELDVTNLTAEQAASALVDHLPE